MDTIVLKFGGTSVSSRKNWDTICDVVKKRLKGKEKPVIVCSALSGISNHLEKLLNSKIKESYEDEIELLTVKHQKLCLDLDISYEEVVKGYIDKLAKLFKGISLVGEISPRLYALVMAHGELMSTAIGSSYLNKMGVNTTWVDARKWLRSTDSEYKNVRQEYLSSPCIYEEDLDFQKYVKGQNVIITQGFIALNKSEDTVLLGRGGSDTSAAYFSAKLKAKRLEIWTDIPGIFTSDPRQIPESRMLKSLDYDEAQEMASTGAKILHPKCILPANESNIPIQINSLWHPNFKGTVISRSVGSDAPKVKGISIKNGIHLISVNTVNMWQQVGFLADIFQLFKKHSISIDLISTSETNVTVSLDPAGNVISKQSIEELLVELSEFGKVVSIGPCSSISLVGKKVRAILHQLAPALEVFEEHKIHLVSQAANDLNLTLVVDEDQGKQLLPKLHTLLFSKRLGDNLLGPTLNEINNDNKELFIDSSPIWWKDRRGELLKLAKKSPLYVYDEKTIRESINGLKSVRSLDKIFYAMKANSNDRVLEIIFDEGLGFECVSTEEVKKVFRLFPKIDEKRVIFTPNFASRYEYEFCLSKNVYITIDNIHPLKNWTNLLRGKEILVRIDTGKGSGHHKFVNTAGPQSKFGVSPDQLEEFVKLARELKVKVVGLHSHIGSGIFSLNKWKESAIFLSEVAALFPDIKYLDLGGGLGVPEILGQADIDLSILNKSLAEFKKVNSKFEIWIEPGRYIVAKSGVLIAAVTQIKKKEHKNYVGINTGMNSLIRPTLYGTYHEIVNLSKSDAPLDMIADVVGPICETGDTLGHDRNLPSTEEGDLLLINAVGAYGSSMSSHYNLRSPAKEYFL